MEVSCIGFPISYFRDLRTRTQLCKCFVTTWKEYKKHWGLQQTTKNSWLVVWNMFFLYLGCLVDWLFFGMAYSGLKPPARWYIMDRGEFKGMKPAIMVLNCYYWRWPTERMNDDDNQEAVDHWFSYKVGKNCITPRLWFWLMSNNRSCFFSNMFHINIYWNSSCQHRL